MSRWIVSSRRIKTTKTELEEKLKKGIAQVNAIGSEIQNLQSSLEAAQRILKREQRELREFSEDLSDVLRNKCVKMIDYSDYKQLIANCHKKIEEAQKSISSTTSAIRQKKAALRAQQDSVDETVQRIAQYGKVIPIWRK